MYPVLKNQNGKYTVDVECRSYESCNNVLFSSVKALGDELLSRPMELDLLANGKKENIEDVEIMTIETDDKSKTLLSSIQTELFFLNVETRVEFDGCCFVRMTVMPKGHTVPQLFGLEPRVMEDRVIDHLYLDIPVKNEYSNLFQIMPNTVIYGDFNDDSDFGNRFYGGNMPKGGIHAPFLPQLILNNEKAGLGVFFETNETWETTDSNRVIEVIENENERVLRIHFLDKLPKEWEIFCRNHRANVNLVPVSFEFGFMALPIKELPKRMFPDNSFHIDCGKKIEGYYKEFFSKPVIEGDTEIGFDRIKRLGVETLYLHEKWNDIQNSTVLTERTKERIKYIVAECHKRGIKVIPYFGYEISTLSPYFGKYHKELKYVVFPKDCTTNIMGTWCRWPAQKAVSICYNHDEYRKIFVDGVCDIIEEFDLDGIYLDSTAHVRRCLNDLHGCSWKDENGVVHPTYPFTAVRETLKGIYERVVEKRGGFMELHTSGSFTLPAMTYCTSFWDGEYFQYQMMHGEVKKAPEGLLRSHYTSRNFGVPVRTLCYSNPPIWTYSNGIGTALLHDSMPKPNDIGEPLEIMSKIWKAYDSFPIEDGEFVPYYSEDCKVVTDCDDVKASYHKAEGKLLCVVSGTVIDADHPAEIDFSAEKAVSIRNVMTGDVTDGDKIKLDIKGYDFYLFEVATK